MKKLVLATLAFCPLLLLVIWSRSYQDPTEENVIPKTRDYEQDKSSVTNDIARLTRIKNDLKAVVDANSPINVAFDAYADFFAGHKQLRGRYGATNYIEGTTVEQMRRELKTTLEILNAGRVTNVLNNFAFKPLNIVLVNATEIPTNFFMGTKVRSVVAPKVTKIGERAFKDCFYLTYLSTSNTVSIGEDAFDGWKRCREPSLDFTWEVPGGVLIRNIDARESVPLIGLKVDDEQAHLPIVDLKVNHNAESEVWARTFEAYEEVSACVLYFDASYYPPELMSVYGNWQQCQNHVWSLYHSLKRHWSENGFYRWMDGVNVLYVIIDSYNNSRRYAQGFDWSKALYNGYVPIDSSVQNLQYSMFRFGDIRTVPEEVDIDGSSLKRIDKGTFKHWKSRLAIELSFSWSNLPTNSIEIGVEAFKDCRVFGDSLAEIKMSQIEMYAFSGTKGLTGLIFNGDASGSIDYMAFANSDLKQLTFETNPDQIADTAFIRFTNKEERESTGILAAQSRHMTNVTFKACSIEDALRVPSGTTNKWYSFLPVGCEIVATNGTYTVQESDVQSWPWHPKD